MIKYLLKIRKFAIFFFFANLHYLQTACLAQSWVLIMVKNNQVFESKNLRNKGRQMHLKHYTGQYHKYINAPFCTDCDFTSHSTSEFISRTLARLTEAYFKCQQYTQHREPTLPEGSFRILSQFCFKSCKQ